MIYEVDMVKNFRLLGFHGNIIDLASFFVVFLTHMYATNMREERSRVCHSRAP